MMDWFYTAPVIGTYPKNQVENILRSLSEEVIETGGQLGLRESLNQLFNVQTPIWMHTNHIFGFLQKGTDRDNLILEDAGSITPDYSLKGQRIKITLDHLRIASYPGGGKHRILFDFFAQNQTEMQVQDLHFNATYQVREGEQAAIRGYPIFIGLPVTEHGIMLRCYTVNIKNEQDETLVEFLEGDSFRGGLRLIEQLQPALSPLSQMAFNLTLQLAKRNRNIPVQDFALGLDFSDIAPGIRLAEGSYVAIQVPSEEMSSWNWSNWMYNRRSGQITDISSSQKLIPFNYMIFSIIRL